MADRPRITIVGGGSTHWTPKLLVDFANTPSLTEADVVLTDIKADALPPMLDVAAHVAGRRGIGLKVRATTDLAEALDGAEYVISALSVGGFASMRHDIEVPAAYGIRQPVGDSVGPGGISRALRSVPVVLGIAEEMERRCPSALLINVSNPLSALCRATSGQTSIRTVGLCNELVGLQFVLSLLFDADLRGVDPVVGGVNHLPLVTSLRIGGDDGFAMLRALLADLDGVGADAIWMAPPAGMHWRKVSPGDKWTKADVVANCQVKFELFSRFGVLPGSSDTHVAEFFAGFVTEASDFGRDWGVHHYGLAGHQADKAVDDASVGQLLASDDIPPWPSGELVATLLEGLVTGEERVLPMNLANAGQVTNLADGVVVECMGVADGDGLRARDVTTVPGWLGEHLRRVAASEELTVLAALTGDRSLVVGAMLADPMAGRLPYERVVTMTDELLDATAAWLPQFSS
jgi:alpha-galactosidase